MGSFSWLVPDEDTSAFIKISDLAQMAQTDTNELPFYITSSAPPEWTIHKNALNPQSRTMSTYFELNDTGYVYNFGEMIILEITAYNDTIQKPDNGFLEPICL